MASSGNPFLKLRKLSSSDDEGIVNYNPEENGSHPLTAKNSPYRKLEREGLVNPTAIPETSDNPFLKLRKATNASKPGIFGKWPTAQEQLKYYTNPSVIEDALGTAVGAPGMKIVGKGLKALWNVGAGSFKNLTPYEQAAQKALSEHEAAKEANKIALENAQELTGKSSVGALKHAKGKAAEELQGLSTGETVPSPELAHQNLLESKEGLQSTENRISNLLNKNAQHDVRVASRANEIINAKKKDIGNIYNSVEKDLANKNITLPNTENAKELNDKLISLIKSGNSETLEAREALEKLENIGKDKVVPARDYLATFRTIRDYAREARKEAYQVGITDEARQAAFKRADALESEVEKMSPILEKGIGDESSKLLKEANSRWSSEIAPLQKNKIYNKMRYEGRLPTNIMKELRGTGEGMEELREIIKNDPELLKNVVGQRFSNKPHTLHDIGELEKEYIEKMPELQSLIDEHRIGLEKINQAESLIPRAEKIASEGEKHGKLKSQIDLLDKQIEKLSSTKSAENMTLSEKIKTERKLKELKNKRKQYRKALLGLGAISFIPKGISAIGKIISAGSEEMPGE